MEELLSAFDIVNFIAAVFGIVTGIVALTLSVVFFFQAKSAERRSENAMASIKLNTEQLNKLSMRMLDRVTKAIIAPSPTEDKLVDVLKGLSIPSRGTFSNEADQEPDNTTSPAPTKAAIEQWRIDNAIAAAYNAAIANLALQTVSLMKILNNDESDRDIFLQSLDSTKADFNGYMSIVESATNSTTRIDTSPLKDNYNQIKQLATRIQTKDEFLLSNAQNNNTPIS
ncbi:hypothetical protein KBD20_03810 [Candidatus Saccharibacteria bacterium]|nr:hypothetical protein [Candidatus Saccharibacteria bacterium]